MSQTGIEYDCDEEYRMARIRRLYAIREWLYFLSCAGPIAIMVSVLIFVLMG